MNILVKLGALVLLAVLWLGLWFVVAFGIGTSSLAEGPETWQPTAALIANILFPITYVFVAWRIMRAWKV